MLIKENLKITFLGICLGLLLFLIPPSIFIPSMVIIIGLLVGIFFIFSKEYDKPLAITKVFIAGFALRLVLCVVLAYIACIKRGHIFFLSRDDFGHSFNAIRIALAWKETGYIPERDALSWMLSAGDLNYAYWLSYLYYFMGEYHFIPLFLNCSLGALSIILIYLLAREIYGYKIAISSALFFAFWPSMVLWSTQNLKEPTIIFIALLDFWSVIKLREKINRFIYWFILLISFLILIKISNYLAFTLLIVIAITLLLWIFEKKIKYSLLLFMPIIYISLIKYWHLINKFLRYYISIPSYSILQALNYAHNVRTLQADTAFLVGVDISSLSHFIIYLPSFILYILFSPFPWKASELGHLFASLEMLIWLFLAIFALRGILITIRYKIKKAYIILIFLIIIFFSLIGEGNVGTLFRHRALIWPCWYIFTSVGLFYHIKDKIDYS